MRYPRNFLLAASLFICLGTALVAAAFHHLPDARAQSSQAQRSAPYTIANPGANAKAVLFDSGSGGGEPQWSRVSFVLLTNVSDATLVVDWYAVGDATANTLPADWPAITASTPFQRDVPLFPGRVRVYIQTVTAPSTWKLAVETTRNRALSQ